RRADKEAGKRRDPRAISGVARVRPRAQRQSGGVCASAGQQRAGHQLNMRTKPSAATFAARYAAGEAQVVWTTLVGDLETPVSAFLKIAHGRPMSFLLESVEGGEVRGRYSIIGLEPDLIFRSNGGTAEVNRTPLNNPEAFAPAGAAPLQALRALIAESRIALPEELPPMAAGVFGYLGYDMVRLMEDSLGRPPPGGADIPEAMLLRPT